MGGAKDIASKGLFLPYTATKFAVDTVKGPPKPEAAPKAPDTPEKEISAGQRRSRDRIRERAMAAGTNRVTGPSGLSTPATTAPKTLLGI
jgi:hypothetical protein